jgi:hypothetical protein
MIRVMARKVISEANFLKQGIDENDKGTTYFKGT